MPHDRLIQTVANWGAPRIVVIGDLILDRFVSGNVNRISPEAPIQVLNVRREDSCAGGAANVATNLAALGADVTLVGIVGQDAHGHHLRELIRKSRVKVGGLIIDSTRPTTTKTRLLAQHQQIVRMDEEETHALSDAVAKRLLAAVTKRRDWDLGLVSDYVKGALSPSTLRSIQRHFRSINVPLLGGPKGNDLRGYKGYTALSLNRSELGQVTGRNVGSFARMRTAANALRKDLKLKYLLATLGEAGMFLVTADGTHFHVPTRARDVFDVTGAGDTALATFGMAIANGTEWMDAVQLANTAAGVVVGKVGTGTLDRIELVTALGEDGGTDETKHRTANELARLLQAKRKAGCRVVFTNGCFDLFHAGHLDSFRFARTHGDVLVVGLNSDRSVQSSKGRGRPWMTEQDRIDLLCGLSVVDYICVFNENTPEKLIRTLKPDVLVKGADWKGRKVAGQNFLESRGGRVVYAPLRKGRSTTDLVERIRNGKNGG